MGTFRHIYPSIAMTVALTLILGIIYPIVVTALAQLLFDEKAQGSLIVRDGQVVGSRLIGQPFQGPGYFHPRPSASRYDPTASGGTNLGPTSRKFFEEKVKTLADELRAENPNSLIPVDLITSSASGLDPHITPAAAEFQIPRIARARKISEDVLRRLVREHMQARQLGVLGEPRVNVMELNLALDDMTSKR
jgi:K+-transporting ATPase ATPase C chain